MGRGKVMLVNLKSCLVKPESPLVQLSRSFDFLPATFRIVGPEACMTFSCSVTPLYQLSVGKCK